MRRIRPIACEKYYFFLLKKIQHKADFIGPNLGGGGQKG